MKHRGTILKLVLYFISQFEDVALKSALWLLDKSGLSSAARSNPIMISRTLSAMVSESLKMLTHLVVVL